MNHNAIHHLDLFLEDISFPTDKETLLLESLDSPVPPHIRDAIALLPEGDYMTREDVRRELIGLPDDDDKKMEEDEDDVAEEKDGESESLDIGIAEPEEEKSEPLI